MTQPLIHGGDWAGFEAQYGRPPLDFSANVSPLGLPESVRRAVEASLPHADRYPDPCAGHSPVRWPRRKACPPPGCCAGPVRRT